MSKTLSRLGPLALRQVALQPRFQTTAVSSTSSPQPVTIIRAPHTPARSLRLGQSNEDKPARQKLKTSSAGLAAESVRKESQPFVPSLLRLRTWLPDEIYSILLQTPTLIPASLPSAPAEGQLSPPPEGGYDKEAFLEEERTYRPRQLIYRFYACGGFWLCENRDIARFLQSFTNAELLDVVPFIRQVMKVRDDYFVAPLHLPKENLRELRIPSSSSISGIREKRDVQLVYNELLRPLAWQGRDTEMLSLWEEAEGLDVKMDWHSYVLLFRCLLRSPNPRIQFAIKAYKDFREHHVSEAHSRAIAASALIALILQRVGPETPNNDLTVDDLMDFTMQLLTTVINCEKKLRYGVVNEVLTPNFAENLSPEQRHVVLCLRLCGRLNVVEKLEIIYDRSRERGIKYTPSMYAFALSAASHSQPVFQRFSIKVLEDMASDGIESNVDIRKALLKGSARCAVLETTFRNFKSIELANEVDGHSIRCLLQGFTHRLWHEEEDHNPLKSWLEDTSNHTNNLLSAFRIHAEDLVLRLNIGEGILCSTTLPFVEPASTLPGLVAQCIASVWYLSRRYPQYFTEPAIYNQYLSFIVRCRLKTAESVFRDCFNHFPLPDDKRNELAVKRNSAGSQLPPYWPLPDLDHSFIPEILPRPDKYTFVRAMEYAHFTRNPGFATEVWFRRESWRANIEQQALDDLQNVRWAKFEDEDLLRYEHAVVDNYTSNREWAKTTASMSKWSDGASNALYEGYTRLLYIQTLAACGWCDDAYKMVLQGTGERYEWTQSMLEKVKKHAANFGHNKMYQYISGLQASGSQNEFQTIQDQLV